MTFFQIVDLCQLMYEKLDSEKFQSVPERTPSDNKKHKENKKFYLAKDRSDAMGIIGKFPYSSHDYLLCAIIILSVLCKFCGVPARPFEHAQRPLRHARSFQCHAYLFLCAF